MSQTKKERIKQLESEVYQQQRLIKALYTHLKISLLPNGNIERWVTQEETNKKPYVSL